MKCEICGNIKKHYLIKCSCGKTVCQSCFNLVMGCCCECLIENFNQYYEEKIRGYAQTE